MELTNKNVEIFNENLWAVNFDHIYLGLVAGIDLQSTKFDDGFCLLDSGVILVNSKYSNYKDTVLWFDLLMKISHKDLGSLKGYFNFIRNLIPRLKNNTDTQLNSFVKSKSKELENSLFTYRSCCYIERKRRLIKKQLKKGAD